MAKQGKSDQATMIKALTHPLRVHILIRMAEVGKLSPRQYQDEENEHLNLVAYHIRVLEKYGAIELVDTRQRRGATEHFYSVAKGSPVVQALLGSQLFDATSANGAESMSSGFLGQLLGPAAGTQKVTKLVPIELDDSGLKELREAVDGAITSILNGVRERAEARLTREAGRRRMFHVGIAAFTWDKGQGADRRGRQR